MKLCFDKGVEVVVSMDRLAYAFWGVLGSDSTLGSAFALGLMGKTHKARESNTIPYKNIWQQNKQTCDQHSQFATNVLNISSAWKND